MMSHPLSDVTTIAFCKQGIVLFSRVLYGQIHWMSCVLSDIHLLTAIVSAGIKIK